MKPTIELEQEGFVSSQKIEVGIRVATHDVNRLNSTQKLIF